MTYKGLSVCLRFFWEGTSSKKTGFANAKLNYFSIQVVSYTPPNKHVDTKDSSNEIQGNALRPVGVHNSVK